MRPPPVSEETWADMVHGSIGNVYERGQREYMATPAATRARAKRDGVSPGFRALMVTTQMNLMYRSRSLFWVTFRRRRCSASFLRVIFRQLTLVSLFLNFLVQCLLLVRHHCSYSSSSIPLPLLFFIECVLVSVSCLI